MTITRIAILAWTIGVNAQAAEPQPKLTVYLRDRCGVPGVVQIPAQVLAGRMFAGIGILLEWKMATSSASSQPAIFIEFVTDTPSTLRPGALAYALPFEGRHIVVFVDRIQSLPHPGAVLAHVMVHEITHLLEGQDNHAATGVMKAHWNPDDLRRMPVAPLSFTPFDLELIHAGMAHGASRTH